ncbi:MAG TPA: phosphate signaling complex protein PhoU [Spirochaetota bacterium]|jgi:phosphate transport system protein|nr:phosphate signaling complex protein PhoU [Spirochaetota bacterium]HOE99889.1 phosphate signaling complex protein PhoU [Spirochaetota bacterium]HOS31809.1 phosphate signaling complex protein PhoU [Spirochaetota bacterium]HOS55583.1 phosphate signaling complex protein PhoU [Spirochaetota bacterium]HPK61186.1 phosphate signaling complex protein PhoU [Spirochaetota bacterium]
MITAKIIDLKKSILFQAATVEKMIGKAIKGLVEKNRKLLNEVIEEDEELVNKYDISIDEKCVALLALYHPEAKDLRTVITISKMGIDLERIGDSAVNIAESALYLISKPAVKPFKTLPKLADETIKMLDGSINAFVNEDAESAIEICRSDYIVNEMRDQIIRELITYMATDPHAIERSIHLIRISDNLERVADLSTNIAEDTVYIATGKIIKHSSYDDI